MTTIIYSLIISPLEYFIENLFCLFYYVLELDIVSAVFFISFAVTLLSLPFYYRADKIRKEEEKKYSELEPYINKIKRNFKGDEQFFMLKTLYRQHNYNPIMTLRNSFSLLLQIPFFIAAYHFFSKLDFIKGMSWGIFQDLSKPDNLLTLFGTNINILPIIMTLINILSCELYLKSKSFKDKIQPYGFALLFLILLYNSPSILVIYWTFNNIFSLLKNKYMKDYEPEKFVYRLLGFMAISYIVCKINDLEKTINIVTQFLYLISPYFIIGLLWIFIKSFYLKKKADNDVLPNKALWLFDNKKITQSSLLIFPIICCFGLILLQGVIIPFGTVTTDLTTFVIELDGIYNTIKTLLENIFSIAGLYLFWGIIILYLLKKDSRIYFTIILISIFIFSLFNYISFGNNLGTLDTNLNFENIEIIKIITGNIYTQSINLLIFFFILSCIILIFKNFLLKQLTCLLSIILFAEILVSGIFSSKLLNGLYHINILNKKNKEIWTQSNYIELSKNNKNVIIIFLDRFLGAFLPIIIEEKPKLKKTFSGFVFYPNTLSYYGHTTLGFPPILGGYEYTPYELDKDERLFSEKWKDATLMLLTLFINNNYYCNIVDSAISNVEDRISIYKTDSLKDFYKSKKMNYIQLAGKYNNKFQLDELNYKKVIKRIQKKLYLYSFLYTVTKFCKSYIYDNGDYLLVRDKKDAKINVWESKKSLITSYSSLKYLKDITTFNQDKNTITIIHNQLPHNMFFLQYPNYKYVEKVTNIGKNRLGLDENSLKSFHTTMASLLLVGEYLKYLKHFNLYDNSRIIIVSDHGNMFVKFPQYTKFQNKEVLPFNPLLMVKDFNQSFELKVDNTLMTNADVPYLSTENIIKNAKNPFTNYFLSTDKKKNGIDVYTNHNYYNISQYDSNKVILDNKPIINHIENGNIFEESNWKRIDYNKD